MHPSMDQPRQSPPGDTPPIVSFVIPSKNEEASVAAVVAAALQTLKLLDLPGEVIVADNNSSDQTVPIASAAGARVVLVPTPGYGAASAGGALQARGQVIVFCDADGSYDPRDAAPLIHDILSITADLAIGNRFSPRLQDGAMPTLNRRLGTPALSLAASILFNSNISDINCGLRAISRSAFASINPRTSGMEFASELIIKAASKGLKISQHHIAYLVDSRPKGRKPHLRPWRDGWRHLRLMIVLAPGTFLALPGALILAAATAIAIRLSIGPVLIARVAFDVHSLLLACVMVLCGYQLLGLALTARTFAVSQGLSPLEGPLARAAKLWTLERGLALAACLALASTAILALILLQWSRVNFGGLDLAQTLRPVIVAVTLLALAFQTIALSLLNELVSIQHR